MKAFLAAVTAFGLLWLPHTASAGRLAGERSLSNTAWGYQIVRGLARAGTLSQRFEVRPGDCGRDRGWNDCENDRERSEFTVRNRWRYGTDQWIGFSVYLPGDFYSSPRVSTTVGQIHQRGGPSGMANGLPSNPPLMQMEIKGDRYAMCLHVLTGPADNVRDECKMIPLASVSAMRGRWTDLTIHLNTAGGTEMIEVFVNGKLKGREQNWIRFRPTEYYLKYGIYRSFVSRQGGPMPTQVLFFDEVKMGRSAADVAVNEAQPVD